MENPPIIDNIRILHILISGNIIEHMKAYVN